MTSAGDRGLRDEHEVQVYLAILRRRWKVIVATGVLLAGLAVGFSMQAEPQYSATARLLVEDSSRGNLFQADPTGELLDMQNADRRLNNQVESLNSGKTRAAVAEIYDGPLDPGVVTASIAGFQSDAIVVTAVGPAPEEEVSRLVNLYVQTYIELERDERIAELGVASGELQQQIDDLTARIAEVEASAPDPEFEDVEEPVTDEVTTLENQRAFYQGLLEDLRVSAGIVSAGGPEILTEAEVPVDPISPKPVRVGVLAGVVGLVLGVGLAYLRDNLDDRLRSVEDVERLGLGYPVLGVIPRAPDGAVTVGVDATSIAEAFRGLRTAIRFLDLDSEVRLIQVTSPEQSDGKSTVAVNLALMLGRAGSSVIAVGADLRRPTLHQIFDVSVSPGFAEVVVGESSLGAAVREVGESVHLLPAGSRPPNPSEILGSSRAERLLRSLADKTDYVVVDTAPAIPVTDPVVVSRMVDATIIVISADQTRRAGLRECLRNLEQAKAPIVGIVLNRATSRDANSYGYAYQESEPREGLGSRLFGWFERGTSDTAR